MTLKRATNESEYYKRLLKCLLPFISVVMTGPSLVIGTATGGGDEAAVEAGIARTETGTAGGVAAAAERGGAEAVAGTESAARIARAMTKVRFIRTVV